MRRRRTDANARRTRRPAYQGFADIEFNPARSINGQARSCALLSSLLTASRLEDAAESPTAVLGLTRGDDRGATSRAHASS